MAEEDIRKVLKKVDLFSALYDDIRLVDPLRKQVLNYKDNTVQSSQIKCYDYWQKENICDNCISIRAYQDNKTYVKFEHTPDRIYMVTAIPYDLGDRRIVIELLKDNTGGMFFDDDSSENKSEIYILLESMNTMIHKDALTNVFNRRFLDERLPVDMVKAKLANEDLSLVMLDIDFFKKVNDQYGHLGGDAVLKGVVNKIQESIAPKDGWIARFGGEEFIICLPGMSVEQAQNNAELIRRKIEQEVFYYKEMSIQVTVSMGIACISKDQSIGYEDAIERADQKLYIAKYNGRNRVEF